MGLLTWHPLKYRFYSTAMVLSITWFISVAFFEQHDVSPASKQSDAAHLFAQAREGAYVLRPLLRKWHIPIESVASFFVISPAVYGLRELAPAELTCLIVLKGEPLPGPDPRFDKRIVWDDLYTVWDKTTGGWVSLQHDPLHGMLGSYITGPVQREVARGGVSVHKMRAWVLSKSGYEALLSQHVLPIVESYFLPKEYRWIDTIPFKFALDTAQVKRAVIDVAQHRWELMKEEIKKQGEEMPEGMFPAIKRDMMEALRHLSCARQLIGLGRIEDFTEAARYVRQVMGVMKPEWSHFETLENDFKMQVEQLTRLIADD